MSSIINDLQAIAAGQQSAASDLGVVTAIDTVNASLTVKTAAPNPITGIRWLSHYTPAIDDFVVLMKAGNGWWVVGKNSKDLRVQTVVDGATTIQSTNQLQGTYYATPDMWDWQPATYALVGHSGSGPGDMGFNHYGMWTLNPSDIPNGAVIKSAKLTIFSGPEHTVYDMKIGLRLHGNTTAPTGPPTWAGTIRTEQWGNAVGGQQTFDLPSSWVTSLITSAARGITIQADVHERIRSISRIVLNVSYTTLA